MENKINKVLLKDKMQSVIKIQKKQMFAVAIEFSLGVIISLLALLGAFLQIGVAEKMRNIYRYVTISLIAVGLLASLLAIRFYKNDNIIEIKYKFIFTQKFLAYIFFALLIAIISIFILSSKYYGTNDVNLKANEKSFVMFRWLLFSATLITLLICLSMLVLNSVLVVKNDTKVSYQTIIAQEEVTRKFEEAQGELQTDTTTDLTNNAVSSEDKEN